MRGGWRLCGQSCLHCEHLLPGCSGGLVDPGEGGGSLRKSCVGGVECWGRGQQANVPGREGRAGPAVVMACGYWAST